MKQHNDAYWRAYVEEAQVIVPPDTNVHGKKKRKQTPPTPLRLEDLLEIPRKEATYAVITTKDARFGGDQPRNHENHEQQIDWNSMPRQQQEKMIEICAQQLSQETKFFPLFDALLKIDNDGSPRTVVLKEFAKLATSARKTLVPWGIAEFCATQDTKGYGKLRSTPLGAEIMEKAMEIARARSEKTSQKKIQDYRERVAMRVVETVITEERIPVGRMRKDIKNQIGKRLLSQEEISHAIGMPQKKNVKEVSQLIAKKFRIEIKSLIQEYIRAFEGEVPTKVSDDIDEQAVLSTFEED